MVTTSRRTGQTVSRRVGSIVAVVVVLAGIGVWYLSSVTVAVLQPRGVVGRQELHLLYIGLALSALVVVPVFVLFAVIAWRYRAGNHRARYEPELDGNKKLETIWWLVPGLIIFALSIITWQSTHALDPFRPLVSSRQPLDIQVVALDWRWLFIYPEQHIASVNFMQLPVDRPVHFTVTADAPMNSFWIPQLGGQIYAMPGMYTELNLSAAQAGNYRGSSANLSGKGFADMVFTARAGDEAAFDGWVSSVRSSSAKLDADSYDRLSQPSTSRAIESYGTTDDQVFGSIANKYMASGMMGMQM